MGRKDGAVVGTQIVQMLVVATLIISLHSQQASAGSSFNSCLYKCLAICILDGKDAMICTAECLSACSKDHGNQSVPKNDYCTLGCSVDQCTKFGRDVDKLVDCVDNCDERTCGNKLPIN